MLTLHLMTAQKLWWKYSMSWWWFYLFYIYIMYGYLSALLPITHNYINLSILFFYWRKLNKIRGKTKSWRRFGNISPKEEEERQSWRIFFYNKIAIILKLTIEWYLTITAWKYIDFICKRSIIQSLNDGRK